MELTFLEKVQLPPPVTCHVSHVTFHVSHVMCPMSHVIFFDRVVKLVGGGLSEGPTLYSFSFNGEVGNTILNTTA